MPTLNSRWNDIRAANRSGVVIAQSAVASAHTGNTTLTTLATVTIPAAAIGANGYVEIEALFTGNDTTDSKTHRINFGGSAIYNTSQVASPNGYVRKLVFNRNSASSQFTTGASLPGTGFGTGSSSLAINTNAAVAITFQAQLANAADTITLEAYRVVVHHRD